MIVPNVLCSETLVPSTHTHTLTQVQPANWRMDDEGKADSQGSGDELEFGSSDGEDDDDDDEETYTPENVRVFYSSTVLLG